VRRATGERTLCLAGGVALNCVANSKLLREGIFDDLWIQPAAGDAGGALGAALFAWHQVLDRPRVAGGPRGAQAGSFLGPRFATERISQWLDAQAYPYHRVADGKLAPAVAGLLAEGKVVGWFSGRMEFGPRALGSRSIIGDARSPTMQSMMNLKIKYRESFRPFAPSCLEEDVGDYFEIDRPSPYMLLVADVRPERRVPMTGEQQALFGIEKLNVPRSDIPAVTHVDYSARLQTVNCEDHPAYYQLIKEFKRRTSVGVIINTSFNVRGEPIVCTPEDAYRCFMRTEMDALVLEDLVLHKAEQPKLTGDTDWRKDYELD
jgi:carbamoyltransferase